jgi:pimeloyl-ACP methyl ester carboxylesterase
LTVHYWDYRGTGESPDPGPYGFESDLADLRDVITTLDLENTGYTLAGHSYGGLPVLKFALNARQPPNGLVLMSTSANLRSAVTGLHERKCSRLGASSAQIYTAATTAVVEGRATEIDRETFLQLEFKNHFAGLAADRFKLFMQNLELSFPVFTSHADWLAVDLEPELEQIYIPTLVAIGDQDTIVPPEFSAPLLKIPGAKSVDIARCGHWGLVEHPAIFAASLEHFCLGLA